MMRHIRFLRLIFIWLGVILLIGKRLWERPLSPNLKISVIDVGQGDGISVQFPFGETWLIDAGGGFKSWNVGEKRVFPYMARWGQMRVDQAVLTHPDQDHLYGFFGVIENLEVKSILINGNSLKKGRTKPLLRKFIETLKVQNIPANRVERFQRWERKGVQILFFPLNGKKVNAQSLVLLLKFAGCQILLTGDMEGHQEEALLEKLPYPIDVLKVAHHGSRYSTTDLWLSKLRPQLAVISAGISNRFHHPHYQVTNKLKKYRIDTLRTDFHGTIELSITPRGVVYCHSKFGSCGKTQCYRRKKIN